MIQDPQADSGSGRRLLIAAGVSLLILFLYQWFIFEPPTPEEDQDETTAEESADDNDGGEAADKESEGADKGETPDSDAEADTDEEGETPLIAAATATIETDYFVLGLTNVGGRITSFELKLPERLHGMGNFFAPLYGDSDDLPDDLPLDTTLSELGLDKTSRYELLKSDSDAVVMRWTSPDGEYAVEKRWKPGDDSYAIHMEVEIFNHGKRAVEDTLELALHNRMGEDEEPGFMSVGRPVSAICLVDDDVERTDLGDEEETFTADPTWIGVDEPYFAVVARPEEGADSCTINGEGDGLLTAEMSTDIDVPGGKSETRLFDLYLGPKEYKALHAYGHGIERSVNYGFFEFLSRPIAWLLRLIEGFLGNWGLAIMLLTVMIRGVLWPVTQKSQESMMRMKDISPQMKELQEKYKNDPTMLQRKQMELFKEHNVSPFGCLPIFLQIPIWFALYRTIYHTAELYKADFFGWIHDLSAPDPYYILPVLAGGLFFLQQRLNPSSGTDTRQKILMTVFPLVFVVVMLFLPSGLNLYILVSSIIGVSQAVYTRKKNDKRKAAMKESSSASEAAEEAARDRKPQTARERRAARRREST